MARGRLCPLLMPSLQRPLALFALAMAACVTLAAGLPTGAVPAAGDRATVLLVGDGDTLWVSRGERSIPIRLACIDASEIAQGSWGQQARTTLMQRLLRGREVTIEPHTSVGWSHG